VGSPTNFNAFRVSGGGATATTDQMTVEGKLAGAPVPAIDTPAATDFASTTVGVPVIKNVTVTSFGVPDAAGASNLTINGVGVGGANPTEFAVVGDTCSGHTFPSGQSCTVNVRYTPGSPGAKSAVLGIAHNAAGGATEVLLRGDATPLPVPAAPVGAPLGAQVAGAPARSALAVSKLRTTHRMTRRRALRRGLRLSMRVPQGTEVLKIAVLRVRKGHVNRKPVWLGFRVVSRAGLYRVRLDSRALRRRLKAGLYQVNVTPGVSRKDLGRTVTTRIRVTRR